MAYLLESLPDEALVVVNEAKNTPIHWAAMKCVDALVLADLTAVTLRCCD